MEKIVLKLPGKPMSTQHIYGSRSIPKGGKNIVIQYMKKEAKQRKQEYMSAIMEQYKGPLIHDRVKVWIEGYFPTMAFADRDNRHKISCDALEGIVLADDKQIKRCMGVDMFKCKEDPHILLTIEKLTDEEIHKVKSPHTGPSSQQKLL